MKMQTLSKYWKVHNSGVHIYIYIFVCTNMYVLRVKRLISTKKFISSGLDVKFLHIQYIHDYDKISKTNISTF